MTDSAKQVALVTGAGRGIGAAIAAKLAADGFHLLINYKSNHEAAKKSLDAILAAGGSAELAPFDVTDAIAAEAAITALLQKHEHIDVLVNNAGIRRDMLMLWMKEEDWSAVLNTNLNSFFNVTKPVLKAMLAKRYGRIINISSTAGQTGNAGQVNYSAAKAGLIGATMALAREVAKRGITVNAIAPGFIETEMLNGLKIEEIVKQIPMQRCGKPQEVAELAAFLASAQSSYITGQVIAINGGIC